LSFGDEFGAIDVNIFVIKQIFAAFS
jgi:hypothetical protein